ncbi:dTDP-4-dehydrorhamnose reductase [Tenacibaculum sp. 190524A02b]|uniref:dTDP-4-dehydrorhamnose reductase n=1 Tax=Tenacibaculum vairaonense TaxID=3137860 RepID=A0ABM9PJS7_9FLAO
MNILVTGANGQLGSEIKELSLLYTKHNFFFEGSKELDITNYEKVKEYISSKEIEAIINCAAYTAVDKAEEEKEKADGVNNAGVANLAKAIGTGKLIHISTDYVFNGENFTPYIEEDLPNPIGVYGITKLEGEQKVLKSNAEAIIIRTSWVYSSFGNNFVKTMLRLGKERERLNVIFDQVGSPTYARDLGKLCLDILDKEEKINKQAKVYHYSNEGVTSWYDFAKAIMDFSKLQCVIYPIETKEYPTPAKRPNYSLLNKAKIKKDFNIEIPYWRDSLKECIKRIENE